MSYDGTSVRRFLQQVEIARTHNSKELRISVQDAENIALNLCSLLNTHAELANKCMELQQQLLAIGNNTGSSALEGGGF
jgi:hypothetical protein